MLLTKTVYKAGKEIKVEELSKGSSIKVEVMCDYCGKIHTVRYRDYLKSIEKFNVCACRECWNHNKTLLQLKQNNYENTCLEKYGVKNAFMDETIKEKSRKTCLEKYGVENAFQSEQVRGKARETCMEKYGVPYASQVPETRVKFKQTCLEKYGVSNPLKSTEIKNKAKETCMERYGVEYPTQSPEVRKKCEETCIKNYGVSNPAQSSEIKEKAWKTMIGNNSVPTSSQEKEIFSIIKNVYPEAINSYPCGNFTFDICLPKYMIDIECDGGYWHMDPQRDRKRDEINKSKGYKILRIRYDHEIPDSNKILDVIKELINTDKDYIRIHSEDSDKNR